MDDIEIKHNSYLPYVVYKNLEKFLKYRKLDLVSGAVNVDINISKFLDFENFKKNIQHQGYIILEAKDSDIKDRRFIKSIDNINKNKPVKTYILLFDKETDHLSSSVNFAKILRRIPHLESNKDSNLDVIVISHQSVNVYLQKKIDEITNNGSETYGYIHIYSYKYAIFTTEKPIHELVSKHEILSKENEKQILEDLKTEKINLPKIRKSDAIAIWYGCEIGDIVKISSYSEASGISIKYLAVKL